MTEDGKEATEFYTFFELSSALQQVSDIGDNRGGGEIYGAAAGAAGDALFAG